MAGEFTLADLKPASYNPRTISPRQREQLRKSLDEYGDLSGIIFNRKTGCLVGGHQRVDLFVKAKAANKTRIVRQRCTDDRGTVAIGHVEVISGKTALRIPYREVEWDGLRERAANIAANSGGGSFDHAQLGRVVSDLERRKYPIELIPIDDVELKRAVRMHEYLNRRAAEKAGDSEGDSDFQSIDPETVRASLDHHCPNCGHSWSDSKPAKAGKKSPPSRAREEQLQDARARKVRTLANESRRNDRARRPEPVRSKRPEPSKARKK